LSAYKYDMLIARLEPENSIEIILDGVVKAAVDRPFLVIGKHETEYGNYLKEKYSGVTQIRFIGGIYNIDILNSLRYYSNLYFHGHTVGGTNPSLLEAMASNSLICANDNPFNRYILGNDAIYFNDARGVADQLNKVKYQEDKYQSMLQANSDKITNIYDWELIVDQYEKHLSEVKGVLNR